MTYVKHQNHFNKDVVYNNGVLTAQSDLIFDGHFTGEKIDVGDNTVIISLSSEINCDIHAGVVEIIGKFTGNIYASKHIFMDNTAVVTGDVQGPLIRIEKLARFQGHMTYT